MAAIYLTLALRATPPSSARYFLRFRCGRHGQAARQHLAAFSLHLLQVSQPRFTRLFHDTLLSCRRSQTLEAKESRLIFALGQGGQKRIYRVFQIFPCQLTGLSGFFQVIFRGLLQFLDAPLEIGKAVAHIVQFPAVLKRHAHLLLGDPGFE
jgi:hypothetical protein